MNINNFSDKSRQYAYFLIVAASIIFANSIIYVFTGNLPHLHNDYNSYALQAQAWLNGQLNLSQNYSHLEIAEFQGKFYVSFPPFPSIALIGLVFLFGANTPDHYITLFTAVIGGIYAYKLAYIFTKNENRSLFLSLFLCIGSNFLFLSNSGGVWFMAQVFAFSLTIISFYYAYLKRPTLSLFLMCCAMGCRPFQAVYIPIIFYIIYKNGNRISFFLELIISSVPAIILGCFYMALNYFRFGNILEFGHNYLPEFQEAVNGQFNTVYLLENIKRLFRLPEFIDNRIAFQKFDGTAFWLVSPIFLTYALSFITNIKSKKTDKVLFWAMPILISLHLVLLCLHRTMGGWHFGNRYTVDTLPALFLALVLLENKGLRELLSIPLMIIGLTLNIVGTIFLYNGIL